MNIKTFLHRFEGYFPDGAHLQPSDALEDPFIRKLLDPCPLVAGMSSLKKQKLLQIAFSCLSDDEAYLEIGAYQGKSLISAMHGNPARPVYACDNFAEFNAGQNYEQLIENLNTYAANRVVHVYNADFRRIANRECIPHRIGVYFNDGAHDEASQYDGIRMIEPLLADEALVIVDDWRQTDDSQSYARAGTERAIGESAHIWRPLLDLPARYNGDQGLWWNGVAVYAFNRL